MLCIGHRGAMGHAPENTLASFAKALELGAHCIELDVHRVEGQLLVFHDHCVKRSSDGHGERIPTLDEVIELVGRRAGINIELKGPDTALAVAERIARLRVDGWPEHLLLVSSFDHGQLQVLRACDSRVRLGLLYESASAADLDQTRPLAAYSVHLALDRVDARWLAQARAMHLRSFVYTVNDPADIGAMRQLEVDGVFTDYPERVLQTNAAPMAAGWW